MSLSTTDSVNKNLDTATRSVIQFLLSFISFELRFQYAQRPIMQKNSYYFSKTH